MANARRFPHFIFLIIGVLSFRDVCAQDFLRKWDFDQDGINDTVFFEYTGGAHCCYNLRVKTTKLNKVWSWETYMDGGYVMGVDDSYPEKFNIMDYDGDSVPEIFVATGTYNGEYSPMSKELLFDYHDGYFFQKPFDIYGYYRSLDTTISCGGIEGVHGFYISRSDHEIANIYLRSSSVAEYNAGPRGAGVWETHYLGKWKLANDTLTIIFTHDLYTDPRVCELRQKNIVLQFIYRRDQCMFESITEELQFFKE